MDDVVEQAQLDSVVVFHKTIYSCKKKVVLHIRKTAYKPKARDYLPIDNFKVVLSWYCTLDFFLRSDVIIYHK